MLFFFLQALQMLLSAPLTVQVYSYYAQKQQILFIVITLLIYPIGSGEDHTDITTPNEGNLWL